MIDQIKVKNRPNPNKAFRKFCAIAKGVEFVMNGANHRMDCATTYPFYIMGGDWGSAIAVSRKGCSQSHQ